MEIEAILGVPDGIGPVDLEKVAAVFPYGRAEVKVQPGGLRVPGGGFNAGAFDFSGKIPLGRLGAAEDMANTALALLSDRFCAYVTGTVVAVDGGLALYNWIDPPKG